MRFYVVIPAHNEEAYIAKTLQSLVDQSLIPSKVVVVNDNSTDNTQQIITSYSKNHDFISGVVSQSEASHQPGSKVINAFTKGYETLDQDYDVICKFDADLIFPTNYLESVAEAFKSNSQCGMAGGFCYIEKSGKWVLESLTNKDHIRGALKAYRQECFNAIGGLKNTMGWDTVDELLAQYNQWEITTIDSLQVQHLKPTGANYAKQSKYKQGEAFYKLRYGSSLTRIASLKLALKKKKFSFYFDCIRGYRKAKKENVPFIVTEEEGAFIRALRWKNIKKKLS